MLSAVLLEALPRITAPGSSRPSSARKSSSRNEVATQAPQQHLLGFPVRGHTAGRSPPRCRGCMWEAAWRDGVLYRPTRLALVEPIGGYY